MYVGKSNIHAAKQYKVNLQSKLCKFDTLHFVRVMD